MTKKLVRDVKNGKIMGVCAGVAGYFGIDPTVVRLLWVLLSFFYSIGIILYLVLACVLPAGEVQSPGPGPGFGKEDKNGFDTSQARDAEVRPVEPYSEDDFFKESRRPSDETYDENHKSR